MGDAAPIARPQAAPADAGSPFDAQLFKRVMRKLAGTVTVFATSSDSGQHGMTATAMCSVSADPPTILIVVNRATRTHPHIDKKQAFTVNVLAEDQVSAAELFASKTDNQFAGVAHHLLSDGCPVIAGAAAYLHCSVESQVDVGTHTIFIGRVIEAGATRAQPLVYQDGQYGRVSRVEERR